MGKASVIKESNTKVMHVGSDRFGTLSDAALKISYEGNRQLTASQFGKYLIDNFWEAARDKLLKEIEETKGTK